MKFLSVTSRTYVRTSLVNQPVFPYTRMRTRKVGGGNARNAHARIRKNRLVPRDYVRTYWPRYGPGLAASR